jgi:membrane protein YdbS with pleckstrin-like domain
MKFLDDSTEEHSCQDESDLKKGWIQLGNKIVAMIGVQMIMNYQRGHLNRTISLII